PAFLRNVRRHTRRPRRWRQTRRRERRRSIAHARIVLRGRSFSCCRRARAPKDFARHFALDIIIVLRYYFIQLLAMSFLCDKKALWGSTPSPRGLCFRSGFRIVMALPVDELPAIH